jgi:hypothetical protein
MTSQVSNGKTTQVIGGTLLAIGMGALLDRTSSLALHACNLFRATALDTAGTLGEIALAALRALQIAAFDHTILFSALSNLLVLFSALVVIATGITLLRKPFAKALVQHQLSSTESSTGDR